MRIYQTMTEIATESLRERIITGQYEPGSRLKPNELEQKLNLGRMAIREGLKELIGSGLVTQEANKGICVALPPSASELAALFDARCALEGKAAEMAAVNMNRETVGELERLYEEMKVPGRAASEYFLMNRKFHLTLYQPSGWDHALVCIINLLDQVISYFAPRASRFPLDFTPYNHGHRLILDALHERRPADLRDLVVANINSGREVMALLSEETSQTGPEETTLTKVRAM
jgi:GntR family transcriptional regulator, carbon starvation induced regulator